jgi:hypothetical protein
MKKKRINVLGENGSTQHSTGSKTVPENAATRWTQAEQQNKHRNIDQRDEGT